MVPRAEAEAVLAFQRHLILPLLHEVASSGPAARDAACDSVRRLLAAYLAAPRRFFASSTAFKGFGLAVSHSVSYLEAIARDSLDFAIEIGLLEEVVADHIAALTAGRIVPDAALSGGPNSAWQQVMAVVAVAARGLPSDESWRFEQLRATARVLSELPAGR